MTTQEGQTVSVMQQNGTVTSPEGQSTSQQGPPLLTTTEQPIIDQTKRISHHSLVVLAGHNASFQC